MSTSAAMSVRVRRYAPALEQAPVLEGTIWFALLMAAICLEGLGRKFLAGVPPVVLYFAKDLVLIGMLLRFGIQRVTWNAAFRLYKEFVPFLLVAVVITALQVFNPEHASLLLGLMGVRAYWFWWLAPLILPSVLTSTQHLKYAALVVIAFSVLIALIAAYQYNLPPDAPVNAYAWGDPDAGVAVIESTSRVRASSTFAYVSGFANYVVMGVLLLLVFAFLVNGWLRWACVLVASLLAFSGVMSGSRSIFAWFAVTIPLLLGVRALNPRVLVVSAFAILLGVGALGLWFPDSLQGLFDRFSDVEETQTRLEFATSAFAPIALWLFDYPLLGIGTGMMLPARMAFGVIDAFPAEVEPQRMLIELGMVGYLAVWISRLGLVIALLRLWRVLRAKNAGAPGRFALALIPICMINQIVMDHVAQSLFFLAAGIVLAIAIQRSVPGSKERGSTRTTFARRRVPPACTITPRARLGVHSAR